jgi:sulfur carrier protein
MNVKLNGKPIELDSATTLVALLRLHHVDTETDGVAAAVNDVVVPKREWAERALRDGDSIELVRAVSGG